VGHAEEVHRARVRPAVVTVAADEDDRVRPADLVELGDRRLARPRRRAVPPPLERLPGSEVSQSGRTIEHASSGERAADVSSRIDIGVEEDRNRIER